MTIPTAPLPNLYEFLDYRAYLKAFYEAQKALRPTFSYRLFSRRAGFRSPNFLKLVIEGKRNLGPASVPRFTLALRLSGEQAGFFGDLVAFNQAKSLEARLAAFERVNASRMFRKARRIEGAMFEYLSRWYYPAIREMTARPDFRDDPRWIATQLGAGVRPRQAASALKVLLDLGLVRLEGTKLTRGEPSLTTGHEVRSLAVVAYHRQMIERAGASLEKVPSHLRDISALTVCVSTDKVGELKQRIHRFREELLALCDSDPAPQHVYQLCLQLFPLTRTASP